jgi:hypothetical protein
VEESLGLIPDGVIGILIGIIVTVAPCTAFDSASNRNEYQENLMGKWVRMSMKKSH